VRLSSIGDVVHTLPALAALHRAGWQAGWIVEPAARALLAGHPLLTGVFDAPPARAFGLAAVRTTIRDLRAARFDAALDFQGLWKSALWTRASGAARTLGFDRASRREPSSAWLVREHASPPASAGHVIDKNLALLGSLGIEAVGAREFPLPSLDAEIARVGEALGRAGLSAFAILNPGGGWAGKLWPPESFGALARGLAALGLASLVSYGPGEESLADRVVAASGDAARKAFPTTLLEYVALARRAHLVIAADTGPLHLACAVGTPVVALFGPTDPARNGPFAADDLVVRRVPPCAPCYRRECVRHQGVMAQIPVGDVLEAARHRLRLRSEGQGAL
jgi:heptosyltransferase I